MDMLQGYLAILNGLGLDPSSTNSYLEGQRDLVRTVISPIVTPIILTINLLTGFPLTPQVARQVKS